MARIAKLEDRLWSKISKCSSDECWRWLGYTNACGYGVLRASNSPKFLLAHRVVYELTHGPIPAGMEVMHSCDQPACCNPDHLSVGTHAENMADMARKGRATGRGRPRETSHFTKVTVEEVQQIQSIVGWPQSAIAPLYGVTQSAISYIARSRAKPNKEYVS